jgi:nicotinate-nucleotide--dimethylbenzimidazole phosphoribosyltransferase
MSYSNIGDFEAALAALPGPDQGIMAQARARQAQLTKPRGSLGRLEELAVFMAGWQRRELPFVARGRALIFAGTHGIAVHDPASLPASVTAEMVANAAAGGAAINALARVADIELAVHALELDRPTADFTQAPAMSVDECLSALSAGAEAVEPDIDLLVLGEMGIGNTAAAAALCAHSLGGDGWASSGTTELVDRALACHAAAPGTPVETLRRMGGRELAAIAGAVVRARQLGIPVVLDGFACGATLAPLAAVRPDIAAHCIAGHCSSEPGHPRLLARLGIAPLFGPELQLGEGSGAALAVGVIRSALAAHADMATFAEAGMSAAA